MKRFLSKPLIGQMNFGLVLGICLAVFLSQAVAEGKSEKSETAPSDPIANLGKKLDEAQNGIPSGIQRPSGFAIARGTLAETAKLLAEDADRKDKGRLLRTCSLKVEVALNEGAKARSTMVTLGDLAQRVTVLNQIAATLDEIQKLERGTSASLRADLEEQKRKARDLREDAEKRFSELNSALIQVKQDARGTIISMSDILFDIGKATLTDDLKTNLAKIAGILIIYKDAKVVVEGHTDNQGGEEYNQKLSEQRAKNVMEYMIKPGGVDAARLTSMGYGFSKPVADNATKEGRQKNRRVDLIVMDHKAANP